MEYKVIYTKRRTVGIVVKDGEVIVRSPRGVPREELAKIVAKHEGWINKMLDECKKKKEGRPSLSEEQIKSLIKEARLYFGQRAREMAEIMGVNYQRLTITRAEHRFGSCNSRGNICFSYRLMLYPPEARLYVIVHELAHLVHLNHSREFYALVARYLPDYKKYEALLK